MRSEWIINIETATPNFAVVSTSQLSLTEKQQVHFLLRVARHSRQRAQMGRHILRELLTADRPSADTLFRVVRRIITVATLQHGDDLARAADAGDGQDLARRPFEVGRRQIELQTHTHKQEGSERWRDAPHSTHAAMQCNARDTTYPLMILLLRVQLRVANIITPAIKAGRQ